MTEFDRKRHWENIYATKALEQLGWHQPTPEVSLKFIEALNLSKDANIIDIGGGDSYLVDNLMNLGYTHLTVLDISGTAVEKAKQRLGKKAESVDWIVEDVIDFVPALQYDLWHDRAAFHFLLDHHEIEHYLLKLSAGIKPGGYLVIGTFSESGPTKCSGCDIKQYSAHDLASQLKNTFELVECISTDHITPSEMIHNYTFCCFKRQ